MTGLLERQTKHEGVCKGCAQGKNVKKPFPSSGEKEKEILDIVHSDFCKPMSSNSLSGYAYYVSFIIYYSYKTWIYFLKTRDEVISESKNLKPL